MKMGIKNLYNALQKISPNAIEDNVPFKTLFGLKVAIDVSVFLYKFVRKNTKNWTSDFAHFLGCLKEAGIEIVCVFDGPAQPVEKREEQQERRKNLFKTEQKLDACRTLLESIKTKFANGDDLGAIGPILSEMFGDGPWENAILAIKFLEEYISKKTRQIQKIDSSVHDTGKTIVGLLGIPLVVSQTEAEKTCCEMAHDGKVDAVMSEDTDVLAYGCPLFISKINMREKTVRTIFIRNVIDESGISLKHFTDLCIMLGCDYNRRASGWGVSKCIDLVKKYGSIENIEAHENRDLACLKWQRCRELFAIERHTVLVPHPETPKWPDLYALIGDCSYLEDFWAPTKILID